MDKCDSFDRGVSSFFGFHSRFLRVGKTQYIKMIMNIKIILKKKKVYDNINNIENHNQNINMK